VNCTKNAFGGQAPHGPAGGAIALPNPLRVIRGREGGKGKERVWNREGDQGREGIEEVKGYGEMGRRG